MNPFSDEVIDLSIDDVEPDSLEPTPQHRTPLLSSAANPQLVHRMPSQTPHTPASSPADSRLQVSPIPTSAGASHQPHTHRPSAPSAANRTHQVAQTATLTSANLLNEIRPSQIADIELSSARPLFTSAVASFPFQAPESQPQLLPSLRLPAATFQPQPPRTPMSSAAGPQPHATTPLLPATLAARMQPAPQLFSNVTFGASSAAAPMPMLSAARIQPQASPIPSLTTFAPPDPIPAAHHQDAQQSPIPTRSTTSQVAERPSTPTLPVAMDLTQRRPMVPSAAVRQVARYPPGSNASEDAQRASAPVPSAVSAAHQQPELPPMPAFPAVEEQSQAQLSFSAGKAAQRPPMPALPAADKQFQAQVPSAANWAAQRPPMPAFPAADKRLQAQVLSAANHVAQRLPMPASPAADKQFQAHVSSAANCAAQCPPMPASPAATATEEQPQAQLLSCADQAAQRSPMPMSTASPTAQQQPQEPPILTPQHLVQEEHSPVAPLQYQDFTDQINLCRCANNKQPPSDHTTAIHASLDSLDSLVDRMRGLKLLE